jgi:hypothetical protein
MTLDPRGEQERPLIWRGPFAVKRAGRSTWKIVNRYGETERLGYRDKGAADEECRLMNLAHAFCDQAHRGTQ